MACVQTLKPDGDVVLWTSGAVVRLQSCLCAEREARRFLYALLGGLDDATYVVFVSRQFHQRHIIARSNASKGELITTHNRKLKTNVIILSANSSDRHVVTECFIPQTELYSPPKIN